ncbi:MAG TPA: hypothetical protein V6D17_01325 [Candidatus Obscuribacterales bacterium]
MESKPVVGRETTEQVLSNQIYGSKTDFQAQLTEASRGYTRTGDTQVLAFDYNVYGNGQSASTDAASIIRPGDAGRVNPIDQVAKQAADIINAGTLKAQDFTTSVNREFATRGLVPPLALDGATALARMEAPTKPVNPQERVTPADAQLRPADAQVRPADAGIQPEKTGTVNEAQKKLTDTLFDKNATPEQKLAAARELSKQGVTNVEFTDANGKKQSVRLETVPAGKNEMVHIFMKGEDGRERVVARGIHKADGTFQQQRDANGNFVSYEGSGAKAFNELNVQQATLRNKNGDTSTYQKGDQPPPPPDQKDKPPVPPDKKDVPPVPPDKKDVPPDKKDVPPDNKEQAEQKIREQQLKDMAAERQKLTDHARQKMDAASFRKFQEDMQRLEDRAKRGETSVQEVTNTYKQVDRLLETDSKVSTVKPEDRVRLAQNIMYHAGDPKNIDQGQYPTCNVTASQERLFTKNPSKAAEMITTTALTGEWKSPDGKVTVKLPDESLKPRRESMAGRPNEDNPNGYDRSHATQILNQVMINDITMRRQPPQTYQQRVDTDLDGRTRLDPDDKGYRYVDSTGKRLPDDSGPNMDELSDQVKRLQGDRAHIVGYDGGDKFYTVKTREDLHRVLSEMKNAKPPKLPAVLLVDANHPDFNGLQPNTTKASWHTLSVTDYDPKTGKVTLSNQWGKNRDTTVSLDKALEYTKEYPRTPRRK